MRGILGLICVFVSINCFSQSNYYLIDTTGINFDQLSENDIRLLDSILPIANQPIDDTTLLRLLDYLAENCWDENLWPRYNDLILTIADKNLAISEDSIFVSYKANALNNVGYVYSMQGKAVLALENYKGALILFEKIGELEGQASPLNNIGYTYKHLGDMDKAIEYYHRALKIREQMGDEQKMITMLNNLAALHEEQGHYDISKEYFLKTLELSNKFDDKIATSLAYSNLGHLFATENKNDSAFIYYQYSLDIRKEIGYKRGMVQSLLNMGRLLEKQGHTKDALEYYIRSYAIAQKQNLKSELVNINTSLGRLYFESGETDKALVVGEEAYELAIDIGFPEEIRAVSNLLSDIYMENDNPRKSLEMYKLSIHMRDSLVNEKNKSAVYRGKVNYEFELRENQRALEAEKKSLLAAQEAEKKDLLAAQERQTQNIILVSVSIGMGLSVLFILFLYNRFLLIKKQKRLIEKQKQIVDEQRNVLSEKNEELNYKNLQITDSIAYAKLIQRAILPAKDEFSKNFADSFIFYKPKDVVSGDFHWFSKVGDNLVFAAADCTGHGVPGAFMSIIGNNILDGIVNSENINQPDLILNKLSTELYNKLNKGKSYELSDGMDIALCSVNLKSKKMMFSGAHNPLYLVRNGELKEFKGDRLHIGNLENMKDKIFSLTEIELQEGDLIYVFTDGFADQKGGERGKKFFYGPFRNLLIENSLKPMEEQKEVLTTTFLEWKGDFSQIDDMLIIGVKIG